MNWEHLRTILWLRSRLSRNQWRRAGRLSAVLRGVAMAVGVALVVGGGVGGLWLGAAGLPAAPAWVTWMVLGGMAGLFMFLWLIGLVVEIQRSEAIDVQRLFHLPVTLGQIFTINYLASLLTPTFLLFLPAFMGLAIGLSWGVGWRMAWLLPLVLSGLFVITAWTYCLRGWLVSLMVNKRRRRAIIAGVTITLILVSQVPNLVFNNAYTRDYLRSKERAAREARSSPSSTTTPDASATAGAVGVESRASQARTIPWAQACGLSMLGFTLGALGLRRAYRMTLRFYLGVEPSRRRAIQRSRTPAIGPRSLWVERRVPGCSEPVSAMSWLFLQSMVRAPETKMAMVMPVVMVLVFGSLNMGRRGGSAPDALRPFLMTGAVAFGLFSILQLAANAFGTDRNGFRSLVLSPVSRASVLAAKNLALLPLAAVVSGFLLTVTALLWPVPAWTIGAGVLQFLTGYLLVCMVGNYTSMRVPFRVAPGSLKPTKTTTQTTLMLFLLYLLFPLALLPLALPPLTALVGSILLPVNRGVVNFLGSALLFGIAAVSYRLSLHRGGEYLQSREQVILETVTSPVE